jgi:hypothetical protein
MPTDTRASGITVETYGDVTPQAPLKLRRRRTGTWPPAAAAGGPGRRRAAGPAPAPLSEEEAIIDAFEGQQLDLVDAIPLAVAPPAAPGAPGSAGRRRRGGVPASPAAAELTVPLGPDESAVVLVERDGVYEWQLMGVEGPAPLPPAAPAGRRRRGGAADAPAPVRTLRFTIDLPPPAAEPAAARRGARRRGLLSAVGAGKIVAYVFRFVARPVLGGAARLLERNVREGLVHVAAPDPLSWATLPDDATLPLPQGRPARMLLLVHGTFSSTVGSFGALAAHEAGQALVQAALAHYDLVIGWDHRTLSALPTDNAVDLAARLERLGFGEPPEVDAIAFSRGGLVLRSLVEHVLPASPLRLALRRAVFVACTNGGTELARPANWHRFVDRYLNLAAAGARAAALVPGFAAAGTLLSSAIRGVGVLVKVLATSAVTDGAVPGLAAMDPGGDFVREINGPQPGQPTPQQTYYCAVTSDFDPDAAVRLADPAVMSPSLLLKLADKATDALYGRPNDLVVHVDSMTQIDVGVGAYVRERLDYGPNGSVHHCNYFAQPRTAAMLAGWLALPIELPVPSAARRGRKRAAAATPPRPPAPGALQPGQARPVAPASQVVTLRSTQSVADALARLQASRRPWVVVERPYVEAGWPVTLHYAFPTALGLGWLRQWSSAPAATVLEAFNLRESMRSQELPAGAPAAPPSLPRPASLAEMTYPFSSQYRAVVINRGTVVDVIAPAEDALALAGGAPAPPTAGAAVRRRPRRSARAGAAPGPAAPTTPADSTDPTLAFETAAGVTPSSKDVECHFRAETDDEVVVQQILTVAVTISRDRLALAGGRRGALGKGKVKATKPLVVECMPMLRLTMLEAADARVQIPVPAAGEPAELRFDLVAQEVGPAEVRVQVRQGPLPLVTLVLTAGVVAARSGTPRPVQAAADLTSFPELPRATDELRIVQLRPTGGSVQYRYDLRLPSRKVQNSFESAVMDTDPASYVAQLHARIEDRWAEHRSEKAAFERDLKAIGADLFDDLFPLELRQLLWQHRDDIRSVQVLSSEPFIPWELVHVRDPAQRKAGPGAAFLGEMGVVRWLVDGYPPETLRLRKGKARYVVPDYPPPDALPEAQNEIDLVEHRFGAKPLAPEAEAVYALLESPGQFDLLHVACHGLADPSDIDSARLEMPGKRRSDGSMSEEHVLATTVAREADLADGEFKPIVVLNACQSLRGGNSLKGVGGFAQAFVQGGAGVIVGSSWSVGDLPAYGFIEAFYEHFLGDGKREPLARAAAAARQKAREDGDATWLAYVVYGHPRAVVPKG